LPEWRVPLSAPSFSEAEVEAVTAVLRSGWWTCGPETRSLEEEFASRLRVPHAVAVSSGTAALHLAFSALGLRPGDEVLTPSLNFVAAANCIRHAGGVPRFVDVTSLDEPLISPAKIEKAITARTRGICVMHYGGHPCAMDAVMKIARLHGLWVVEDAAHAPGAKFRHIACGAWGDVGCFSFFGNKNLTCAEGGMITTSDDRVASLARTLRSHGMSSMTWDRYQGHQHSYEVSACGFNYRMDDLRAAILRVQLALLPERNRRRGVRVSWYRELLSGDSRWTIPFAAGGEDSAHHLFTVVLAKGLSREHIMGRLRADGIQSSVHYPPVHQFACHRELAGSGNHLEITEALGRRLLSLPLYPDMTREQVGWVAEGLRNAAA
jgi:dTDP-4-amino-4,6-dideoxygalactose transaminase